jgi:hypothetical protein
MNYKITAATALLLCSTLVFVFSLNAQPAHAASSSDKMQPDIISKDKEIESLKESLQEAQDFLKSAAEEIEKNRRALEILRAERDAETFQKTLRHRSESAMGERYRYEALLRQQKENDFLRLRGNLLFPGAGQIYLGESRGYIWAGLFSVFLGAALSQNQVTYEKRRTMQNASMNPLLFESSRADYLNAYNQYTFAAFSAAAVFAASAADAAFISPSADHTAYSGITLSFSVKF